MLKPGDIVKIIYSDELRALGLNELVKRKGIITAVVKLPNGRLRGAYFRPKSGRLRNEEWFIPIQSIESDEQIYRLKTFGILKKTIL